MSANHLNSSIDLLSKLVAFPTVSATSNLELIGFIEEYLQALSISCARVPSPDGVKSNLLARIGPEAAGGMVLSGHTDVVPVKGQSWESEPFTLIERDGKLYGRGSCDMKGFIAACLALAPHWAAQTLAKPIYLAFSYDEEVGCLGVPYLLNELAKHAFKPAFAVIGEPTMMQVVTAHKGVLSFETTVRGLEWHSSQPHYGVNAVHYACELVQFLTGLETELAHGKKQDERFDPPHSTVHVGIIHGGTARNIIPKECHFNWEIRPLPGDDADAIYARFDAKCQDVLARMKKTYKDAEIVSAPVSRMMGVQLPKGAEAAREHVMRAALTNQELAVAFGTEAGVFNERGIPAIVCGPGNIEQAHKPNEFIERSQMQEALAFLLRLTERPGQG